MYTIFSSYKIFSCYYFNKNLDVGVEEATRHNMKKFARNVDKSEMLSVILAGKLKVVVCVIHNASPASLE
jgi:hypothetical protein